MAIDYTALAATAATLIQDNGRDVTLRRINQSAANAAEPWKGPADPAANFANTDTVKAVFVPPSSASELGMSSEKADMLGSISQIAIVEPGSFDFLSADEMVDGGHRMGIEFVEKLQPAATVLLYFIGVKR